MDAPVGQTEETGVVAFEVLGVGVVVKSAQPELAHRIREALPPGANERPAQPDDIEFTIARESGNDYWVHGPDWEEPLRTMGLVAALDRLRAGVLEHVVRLAARPKPGPEPPPAIRFVTLVLELEGELAQLAKTLESAAVDAVLLNGDEVRSAVSHGSAFSFSAVLEIPRPQIPGALGAMETVGWQRMPHVHGVRYIRHGMVVRIQPRGSSLGWRGETRGPLAKGRFGLLEPEHKAAKGKPEGSLAPVPLDPGGPLRTGWIGVALQCAAEALTALDTRLLRTKEREFRGLRIQYGPGVFAFQSLTAGHVEAILTRLPPEDPDLRLVEVGTGTGAVALSIAAERPRSEVLATDVSLRALGWARRNRRRLGLHNVRLVQGSLLAPVPASWRGRVAAIAANPPLAPPQVATELHVGEGWPIGTATGPGADGLGLVRALARDARDVLRPGGYLHLHLQDMQSAWIVNYFDELGYESEYRAEGGGSELTALWPGTVREPRLQPSNLPALGATPPA